MSNTHAHALLGLQAAIGYVFGIWTKPTVSIAEERAAVNANKEPGNAHAVAQIRDAKRQPKKDWRHGQLSHKAEILGVKSIGLRGSFLWQCVCYAVFGLFQ